MTRILIPLHQDESFIPDIGIVYWVDTTILNLNDPETQRPVVVMTAPQTTTGTIRVATRSTTESNGIPHPRSSELGLTKPGWFSRRASVQCQLWTPGTARSTGLLEADIFAAVCARFL